MNDWTEQQKKAIDSRGKNLIVSAGAGSGKTAVMIERICALLAEGADLRRMLVCTFTKTAASDMKRKLAERLADDPKLNAHVARLAGAQISTLHSWCAHVIKTLFFACDLDPEFTVLEEGEAIALENEAAEEVIAEEKEKGNEDFAGLYAAFYTGRSHRRLKEAVVAVYDYARAQPDPAAWLHKSAQRTDGEYRRVLLDALAEEGRKLLQDAEILQTDLCAAGFAADESALSEWKDCVRREVACTAATPVLRGKPEWIDLHERFKQLKADYADLCRRREKVQAMPSHEGSLRYCRALCALAEQTGARYTQHKRARGKADYADLEHEALGILRTHRKEIVSAYDYVFVDEYQDISPLQETILRAFDCRMFFVGDVKQSIYGFRMCSPEFFREKYARYKAGEGETVDLTRNFRSGGTILDTVNGVFSRVMTKAFGGADYDDGARLVAGKSIGAQVRTVLIEKENTDESEPLMPAVYSVQNDRRTPCDRELECEADLVTEEILAYTESKNEDGSERGFGDIAVLVRSRNAFTDLLEKRLRAASVPVSVVSSDTAASAFVSVAGVLSMLTVLDNARDDVNLAAVMCSPAFGAFTGDELVALRERQDGAFCDCVADAAHCGQRENGTALESKTARFLAQIDALRDCAATQTVAELAGEITAKYDCFYHALKTGGEREAAALDSFLEHLAAQTEYNRLHEYLRHVARTGMPVLKVPSGGNAVRIMTVHASKGLEFPFVILPELHKQFNMRDVYASVICDADEGVVLRSFDFAERAVVENPRYAVCARKCRRALAEEELRILYVAMTRAQKRLSLYATVPPADSMRLRDKEQSTAYIEWIYESIARAERVRPSEYRPRRITAKPRESREPDRETVRLLTKRFEETEHTDFVPRAVKASVSGLVHEGEEENVSADLFPQDDRAAKRGSAYHKFMQWADFGAPDAYARLCARFPDEGALTDRAEMERAFAVVNAFIGGREFYREKAFVLRTFDESGTDGAGMLVQGVVDLLVVSDDGSVDIVDYKTGSEQSLASPAYAAQLGWYKKAVESVLHKKVRGTYLYGFSCGKLVEIGT